MKTIYVIVHTESVHHISKVGGGWFDTALTENGTRQAHAIADKLLTQVHGNCKVFSSDLKRAAEVAGIIAGRLECDCVFDYRLREMRFGEAEGRPKEWQEENINVATGAGRLDERMFTNAETRRELATRIDAFMEKLHDEMEDTAVVVTHGFALTFVVLSWLRVDLESMGYAKLRSDPGGVSLLIEDDRFGNREVVFLNSREFLPASSPPCVETTNYRDGREIEERTGSFQKTENGNREDKAARD